MAYVCGRFSNQTPSSAVGERFEVELPPDYRGRANVTTTQSVLAIRHREYAKDAVVVSVG
jgi:hypothetical protein